METDDRAILDTDNPKCHIKNDEHNSHPAEMALCRLILPLRQKGQPKATAEDGEWVPIVYACMRHHRLVENTMDMKHKSMKGAQWRLL